RLDPNPGHAARREVQRSADAVVATHASTLGEVISHAATETILPATRIQSDLLESQVLAGDIEISRVTRHLAGATVSRKGLAEHWLHTGPTRRRTGCRCCHHGRSHHD